MKRLFFLFLFASSIVHALPVLNEGLTFPNPVFSKIYPDNQDPDQFWIVPHHFFFCRISENKFDVFLKIDYTTKEAKLSAAVCPVHLEGARQQALEYIKESRPNAKVSDLPPLDLNVDFGRFRSGERIIESLENGGKRYIFKSLTEENFQAIASAYRSYAGIYLRSARFIVYGVKRTPNGEFKPSAFLVPTVLNLTLKQSRAPDSFEIIGTPE